MLKRIFTALGMILLVVIASVIVVMLTMPAEAATFRAAAANGGTNGAAANGGGGGNFVRGGGGGSFLFGALSGSASQSGSSTNVQLATIQQGDLSLSVPATGTIMANQTANLTFDTNGTIKDVLVQEGQSVKAGQVLAVLDDTTQQASLKQALANLQSAQAALDKVLEPVNPDDIAIAEANVKSAQASYSSQASSTSAASIQSAYLKYQQALANVATAQQAQNDAGGRYSTDDPNYQKALAATGQATFNADIARLNYESSQQGTSLLSATANIALNQAKLAQVKAGPTQISIDQAQASVISAQISYAQAQHQLDQTQLKAPFDGVISQINLQSGEPASGVVMVITDTSSLHVDANVDETNIMKIQPGQKVEFTVDALPGAALTGTVQRVDPLADTTGTVIEYPVHILLDPTNAPIKPGMTANATFHVKDLKNALLIPNLYVRHNPTTGQDTVTLLNPNTQSFSTVAIKVGLQDDSNSEVIEGLMPGDRVALISTNGR
jgi:HlyD family secretion protein